MELGARLGVGTGQASGPDEKVMPCWKCPWKSTVLTFLSDDLHVDQTWCYFSFVQFVNVSSGLSTTTDRVALPDVLFWQSFSIPIQYQFKVAYPFTNQANGVVTSQIYPNLSSGFTMFHHQKLCFGRWFRGITIDKAARLLLRYRGSSCQGT